MTDEWSCGACRSGNAPEDRFCGQCGSPRDRTVVTPVARLAAGSKAPLSDVPNEPVESRGGLFFVLGVGIVSAGLFGWIYHLISTRLDLMILFPVLLGFAIGGVVRMAALKSGCRRASLLVLIALASATAGYGLRETLDTLHFQAFLNQRKIEEEASHSFGAALLKRADMGISFGSRAGRPPLSGNAFWVYLFFQAALAAGVAAFTVAPVSRLAYCGRCRSFVPTVPVFRANARDAVQLADAVRSQKWKAAQDLSNRASATPRDRAEAVLIRCPGCGGSSIRIDVQSGRRSKRVMHVTLPPESLEALARTS